METEVGSEGTEDEAEKQRRPTSEEEKGEGKTKNPRGTFILLILLEDVSRVLGGIGGVAD